MKKRPSNKPTKVAPAEKATKVVLPETPSKAAPLEKPRRWALWGLLPLGVGIALLAFLWPRTITTKPSPPGPPRPPEAPVTGSLPLPTFDRKAPSESLYIGAARCLSCHPKEHAAWQGKAHATAMQPATPATVIGDFKDHSFEGDGITARMLREGERFFFETDDAQGKQQRFSVDFTLGGQRTQEYLTALPDGRLQVLPLSYSSIASRWFAPFSALGELPKNSPFYWTNSRRTFNRECFDCHLTGMETRYDVAKDQYQTTWRELGISCEACHGPGKQHADKPSGDNIVSPARLNQARQLALCGRCHSARTMHFSLFNNEHRFFPGDEYLDFFTPLMPGQVGPRGSVAFYMDGRPNQPGLEYQAILQSRCAQGSRMTCSTCHSSHKDGADPGANELCGGCHPKQYAAPGEHSKHNPDGTTARCVSCHMPKSIPAGLGKATDHSLEVPNPDNTRDYDIPNACNGCHSERTASWAGEQFRALYGAKSLARRSEFLRLLLGVGSQDTARKVQDDLISFLQGREVPFLQAIAALSLSGYRDPKSAAALSLALTHPDALVRATAAQALATLGKDRPLPVARDALVAALEDSQLWVRLQAALSLFAMNDSRGAAYIEAQAAMPEYQSWFRIRGMLAIYYAQRGQGDQAQEEARVTLLDKPDFVEVYRLLVNLFVQRNQPAEADIQRRLGARFDPSDKAFSSPSTQP